MRGGVARVDEDTVVGQPLWPPLTRLMPRHAEHLWPMTCHASQRFDQISAPLRHSLIVPFPPRDTIGPAALC